jgi:hypothetical protein
MIKDITCKPFIPNFVQITKRMWKIRTHIHLWLFEYSMVSNEKNFTQRATVQRHCVIRHTKFHPSQSRNVKSMGRRSFRLWGNVNSEPIFTKLALLQIENLAKEFYLWHWQTDRLRLHAMCSFSLRETVVNLKFLKSI